MTTIGDPIQFAESRLGIRLKKVGREEYAGPCPWCGGVDRWHCWERGNYYCRPGPGHCGRSGWLDELDGARQLSQEELLELRVAALERKQAEHEARLSALEQMHQCTDHLTYHADLEHHVEAVDYWLNEGINPKTIHDYQLGYCSSCPTAPGFASVTIPVTYQGQLYNIRHRLLNPANGGKYRPHMAGLPSMIFNADDLLRTDEGRILILEGEKKSLVVGQETGLPNIATMGKQAFKPGWTKKLDGFREVLVCYDPDATEQAAATAQLFGKRGRLVRLPVKADDFFFIHNGTASEFRYYLSNARIILQ